MSRSASTPGARSDTDSPHGGAGGHLGLDLPEARVEGRLKVTGEARYTADVHLPGTLWAAFVTSPYPHALIENIDTSGVSRVPGVRAVLVGSQLPHARIGRRLQDWPVLAVDRVRFIGERVAAVAAESREAAAMAAAAIQVTYEELAPALGLENALAADAPVLHPEAASYRFVGGERAPVAHPNLQSEIVVERGEPLDAVFAGAARVFEHSFTTPRHHQGYLEPHAALVWIAENDRVHIVSTNKTPFALRIQLASSLDLPEDQIVVDNRFIGGDFGGKGLSIDEPICYYLARATGRPVRSVASYVAELESANPRHAATMTLRSGVDAEGRLIAHRAVIRFDGGAYAAAKPLPTLSLPGALDTMGPYRIRNVRIEVSTVYTNTVPAGHMRCPGEVQAVFAGESHIDMIRQALDMDPFEFRRRNAIRTRDRTTRGAIAGDAHPEEVLDLAARAIPTRPVHEVGSRRGLGLAFAARHTGGGTAAISLEMQRDGRVTVRTGVPDQGGGAHTVLHRVVTARLGRAGTDVDVIHVATDEAPVDLGVGASRVTHVLGQAAIRAADELRRRLIDEASARLGRSPADVELGATGLVGKAGRGHELLSWAELGMRFAPLAATGEYQSPSGPDHHEDLSFSALLVEVEVDAATGATTITDATLVADVGAVINPVAHEGQLRGGFIFGLGAAMMEDLAIADGKISTLNLGDYKLPTAMDVPPLRLIQFRTGTGPGPFGAKMAGELSTSLVAPAIANAIAEAVGVRVSNLPITAERVFAGLATRSSTTNRS